MEEILMVKEKSEKELQVGKIETLSKTGSVDTNPEVNSALKALLDRTEGYFEKQVTIINKAIEEFKLELNKELKNSDYDKRITVIEKQVDKLSRFITSLLTYILGGNQYFLSKDQEEDLRTIWRT